MAKKKKRTKAKVKSKARRKKLSVKKRPVKDLDASKAKGPKGGLAVAATEQHVKFAPTTAAAVKLGGFPTVTDTYQKLG